MTKIRTGNSLTLIAILIAAIGVLAPITWDWWTSSSEISLTKEHTVTIVEKKSDVENLTILYSGRQIDTLSKLSFELKNTGRTAITIDDLISEPLITLDDGSILEANIDSSIPLNIDKSIELEGDSVTIRFKLLNPGDSIKFSLLSNRINPGFSATARIKNVKALRISKLEDQVRVSGNIGFIVYVVSAFTLLFFIATLTLLTEPSKIKLLLTAIEKGECPIRAGEPIEVVLSYIELDLSVLTKNKRRKIKTLVPLHKSALTESDSKNIINEVRSALLQESPIAGAILSFALAILGGWYVFNAIFI